MVLNNVEKIETVNELASQLRGMIEMDINTEMDEHKKAGYEARIRAKLESGKRLTPEEMQYLRRYNPTLYTHAVRIENARRSVEEQLKHARSKEQVEEIQYVALTTISKKDPVRQYMIAAIQDAVAEFKKTSAYQQLPQNEEKKNKNVNVPLYEFDENSYLLAYATEETKELNGGFTACS